MRKLLLAATMLVPFAAFAGGSDLSVAGDVNLARSTAGSTAGVQSSQGTHAQITAGGTGGVIVGAIAGNSTTVGTTALGKAGPAGSYTNTTATQTNLGGTVAAGAVIGKGGPIALNDGHGSSGGASFSAGGGQGSQASGGSSATASNMNLGGFASAKLPRGGR